MDLATIRRFCKSLPHVEEDVEWGHDLCFLIGNRMFCVLKLEPQRGDQSLVAFQATPEQCAELIERDGVIPAPYMARYHWVSLADYCTLPWIELKQRIRTAYELVLAKLPKRLQTQLAAPSAARARKKAAKARLSKRK